MKLSYSFALLAAAGCSINLDTETYPTQPPRPADLVGPYRPTSETLTFIKEQGGYPERDISIALHADGTCRITNIPDWWRDGIGKPGDDFDTATGKWQIVRQQGWYQLGLDFPRSVDQVTSQKVSGGLSRSVPLVGKRPPYAISFYVGDPDSGRVMMFRREKPGEPK